MDLGLLRFTLITLLSLTLTSASVRALCGKLTLEEQFARSTAVFVGRATAQELETPESPRTVTTFAVEEVWKGASETTLRVRACGPPVRLSNGDDVICGAEAFHFAVGSTYLVFATGNPLRTNECQPTALVNRAGPTLQWLSGKPHTTFR
jgi:hypothetical protein